LSRLVLSTVNLFPGHYFIVFKLSTGRICDAMYLARNVKLVSYTDGNKFKTATFEEAVSDMKTFTHLDDTVS